MYHQPPIVSNCVLEVIIIVIVFYVIVIVVVVVVVIVISVRGRAVVVPTFLINCTFLTDLLLIIINQWKFNLDSAEYLTIFFINLLIYSPAVPAFLMLGLNYKWNWQIIQICHLSHWHTLSQNISNFSFIFFFIIRNMYWTNIEISSQSSLFHICKS